jgi:murein DD-endopeptidase MepM/ murein hydrolase activator NlpD
VAIALLGAVLLGGLFPVTIQGAPVTPELRVASLPLPGLAASAPMAAVTSLEAGPLTLTIVAPAVWQDALLAAADSTEQTLNTIQQAQQRASVTVEIVSSRDPTPIPQYYRYEVKPGETLTSIAQRFGVSNEYIVWNNIDVIDNADLLAVGDVLQVPAVPGIIHGIRAGETLTEIARAYDAEIEDIISFSANGLSDPNSLKEGTFILVVGGRRLPPAAATLRPTPTFVDRESSATGFSWPVFGTITSEFGVWHPLGIDIGVIGGTGVSTAAAGKVIFAGGDTYVSYGLYVEIDHGNGYTTLYAHLSSISVGLGEWVEAGQLLGRSGDTGRSTGPHLHFELSRYGIIQNPMLFLP